MTEFSFHRSDPKFYVLVLYGRPRSIRAAGQHIEIRLNPLAGALDANVSMCSHAGLKSALTSAPCKQSAPCAPPCCPCASRSSTTYHCTMLRDDFFQALKPDHWQMRFLENRRSLVLLVGSLARNARLTWYRKLAAALDCRCDHAFRGSCLSTGAHS